MDALTIFGIFAVGTMFVAYVLEARAPGYVLLFSGACLASSIYGFLQGAWPLGVIEVIWSAAAFGRWYRRIARNRSGAR